MPNNNKKLAMIIDATPQKRIIISRARQYTFDLALFELIDNSLDMWKTNQDESNLLKIKIKFLFNDEYLNGIIFSDNAGGVPYNRLRALVTPGIENPFDEGIGVWGEGLKVACFALGERASIYTRHGDNQGYVLELDEWLKAESWNVPCYEFEGQNPGSTKIEIMDVIQPITREEIFGDEKNTLIQRISRAYGILLANGDTKKVRIYLEDENSSYQVKSDGFGTLEYIYRNCTFPPGFEPSVHYTTFDHPGGELECKMIIGLFPIQKRDFSGVSLWGNGRLFDFAKKEYSVGFGSRGRAKLPASHPTMWRLSIWLFFTGNPMHIPWGSPAKQGYNENNPIVDEIRDFIISYATPYAIFTRNAKRMDLIPYSSIWNNFDEDERYIELSRYFTNKSEESIKEVFNSLPLFSHQFTPKALIEWDHEKNPNPPKELPCFSENIARKAVKIIIDRDKDPEKPFVESYKKLNDLSKGIMPPRKIILVKKGQDLSSVTVRLPNRVIEVLENNNEQAPISVILRNLALREAGLFEPLLLIPQENFRSIVEEALKKIKDNIPEVQAIILFGSVSTGEADRSSDIDLMIIHPDPIIAERNALDIVKEFENRSKVEERYKISPLSESMPGIENRLSGEQQELKSIIKGENSIYLFETSEIRNWRENI